MQVLGFAPLTPNAGAGICARTKVRLVNHESQGIGLHLDLLKSILQRLPCCCNGTQDMPQCMLTTATCRHYVICAPGSVSSLKEHRSALIRAHQRKFISHDTGGISSADAALEDALQHAAASVSEGRGKSR